MCMTDTITQENLYLLLPFKVSYMAEMLNEDCGVGLIEAVKKIYSSATYQRLEREESKAWNLGPATLYYDLMHEPQNNPQSTVL